MKISHRAFALDASSKRRYIRRSKEELFLLLYGRGRYLFILPFYVACFCERLQVFFFPRARLSKRGGGQECIMSTCIRVSVDSGFARGSAAVVFFDLLPGVIALWGRGGGLFAGLLFDVTVVAGLWGCEMFLRRPFRTRVFLDSSRVIAIEGFFGFFRLPDQTVPLLEVFRCVLSSISFSGLLDHVRFPKLIG